MKKADELKNKKLRRKGKKQTASIVTIYPVLLWMIILVAIPLFIVFIMGFLTRGVYGQLEYIFTLQNYVDLFKPVYMQILAYSLWISLITTLICLVLAYPFAYFIANVQPKYRVLLFMLIIIPFWTSSLVRTYAWMIILGTNGIINSYLIQFGIIKEPLKLLYTNGAVILGLVYTLFPFMVLPLYASIEGLDKSYIEAASDLGASPLQAFLRVTLPLTMSGVAAGSVLVFIPSLGLFFIPDLLGGGKTMLISNLIQNQFLTARNWPFGSAISILLIIITIIFIVFYFKKSKNKGLEVM